MKNKRIGDRPKFYSDGITRATGPFFVAQCDCGYMSWTCLYKTECPKCGNKNIKCNSASKTSEIE